MTCVFKKQIRECWERDQSITLGKGGYESVYTVVVGKHGSWCVCGSETNFVWKCHSKELLLLEDRGSGGEEDKILCDQCLCPFDVREKQKLWEDLIQLKCSSSCFTWVVVGDFNSVRRVKERRGVREGKHMADKEIQFNLWR